MYKLEMELKELHMKAGYLNENNDFSNTLDLRNQDQTQDQHMRINADKNTQTNMSFAIDNFDGTVVFVHVCWPTGTRSRKLSSDLTQMAIYLLRTQNTNMAKFALKHPLIRAHLIKLIGKEINIECQGMCRESVKVAIGDEIPEDMAQPRCKRNILDYHSSPLPVSKKRKQQEGNTESGGKKKFFKKDVCSIFKKTSKDMSSFSFEKAELEMKDRCPMFYTMLKSASMSQCKSDE